MILPLLMPPLGFLSERTFCGSKQLQTAAVSFQKRGIPLETAHPCSKKFPMALQGDDCYYYFNSVCLKVWLGVFCLDVLPFLALKRKGWSRGRPAGDALPSSAEPLCAPCYQPGPTARTSFRLCSYSPVCFPFAHRETDVPSATVRRLWGVNESADCGYRAAVSATTASSDT